MDDLGTKGNTDQPQDVLDGSLAERPHTALPFVLVSIAVGVMVAITLVVILTSGGQTKQLIEPAGPMTDDTPPATVPPSTASPLPATEVIQYAPSALEEAMGITPSPATDAGTTSSNNHTTP